MYNCTQLHFDVIGLGLDTHVPGWSARSQTWRRRATTPGRWTSSWRWPYSRSWSCRSSSSSGRSVGRAPQLLLSKCHALVHLACARIEHTLRLVINALLFGKDYAFVFGFDFVYEWHVWCARQVDMQELIDKQVSRRLRDEKRVEEERKLARKQQQEQSDQKQLTAKTRFSLFRKTKSSSSSGK